MDIITEFIRFPEMCEHLKKAPLTIWELANLIINAPESLEKKKEALLRTIINNSLARLVVSKWSKVLDFSWILLHVFCLT